MGKALVFNGIEIQDPLSVVNFNDGLSADVRRYLSKLSANVSSAQKAAFQTFYQTLVDNNLLSGITYLYPMFGNANDCAFGLKGNDLIIPNGAVYNKGIDLTNAYGGFGYLGKGIKIGDNYPSNTNKKYSQYYNMPYGYTSLSRGWPIMYSTSFSVESSIFRGFGPGYSSLNIGGSIAVDSAIPAGSFGLFGETHDFSATTHRLFNNSTILNETIGSYLSTTDIGEVGINCSPQNYTTHLLNHPINMIILCNNTFHTPEQVAILSTAVATLSAVIF